MFLKWSLEPSIRHSCSNFFLVPPLTMLKDCPLFTNMKKSGLPFENILEKSSDLPFQCQTPSYPQKKNNVASSIWPNEKIRHPAHKNFGQKPCQKLVKSTNFWLAKLVISPVTKTIFDNPEKAPRKKFVKKLSKTHQLDRFLTIFFWRGVFPGRQKLVVFVSGEMTSLASQKFVDLTTLPCRKFVSLTTFSSTVLWYKNLSYYYCYTLFNKLGSYHFYW